MVTTFVRLKLRLLANLLRISRQVAFGFWATIVTAGLMVTIGFGVTYEINRDTPELIESVLICVPAVVAIMWAIVPLTIGYSDGTIDPLRLVTLPISSRSMVIGLVAASLASPMPVATFALLHAPVVFLRSVPQILFLTVSAAVATVLFVVLGQVCSVASTTLISRRGTRELMSAVLATLGASVALGSQFLLNGIGAVPERWLVFARSLRFSPGGWFGQGMVWAQTGSWVGAIAMVALGLVAIAALVAVWAHLLERLLTKPADQVATRVDSASSDTSSDTAVLGPTRWLPAPIDATTTRALRSLRRDHREWAGIITTIPLMLFVALPALRLDSGEDTLFLGGAASYLGLSLVGLFAFDGSAIWLEMMAAQSLKEVIIGKLLARMVLLVPVLGLAGTGVAAWTGGWKFLPTAILLSIGALSVMAGIGAVLSVKFALPVPEGSNPFAGSAGSAGVGFAIFGGLLVGLAIIAIPSALVITLSYWNWWAGLIAAPLALIVGAVSAVVGVRMAANEADRDQPALLAKLSIK